MKREKTEDSRKMKLKGWTIGKDVQAYFSNCLVVLHFHGVVLSDKVKASSYSLVGVVIVWYEYRS